MHESKEVDLALLINVKVSKYDSLADKYFGQPYRCLTIDDKITITDIWAERNE